MPVSDDKPSGSSEVYSPRIINRARSADLDQVDFNKLQLRLEQTMNADLAHLESIVDDEAKSQPAERLKQHSRLVSSLKQVGKVDDSV